MPSFSEIIDRADCRIPVDRPDLLKVEFAGKTLEGVWLLE